MLVLDADERLDDELQSLLRSLVEDSSVDAYSFSWPYVSENGELIGKVSLSNFQ